MSEGYGRVAIKNSPPLPWREWASLFVSIYALYSTRRLACRTCFWGGDMFAPKLKVKGPDGKALAFCIDCDMFMKTVVTLENLMRLS